MEKVIGYEMYITEWAPQFISFAVGEGHLGVATIERACASKGYGMWNAGL